MGNTRPILQGCVSAWEDGVTHYGYDAEINPDVDLYLLAHNTKDYNIRREEDGDEMDVRENEFELYAPDELSVDEYEALQERGFHFHRITMDDLIRMLRAGFDGRECGGSAD